MIIRKTPKSGTYFKGNFELRGINLNWATPIDFPTVFTAYGKAIKSGNWRSCTAINTPQYVIDNYFEGNENPIKPLWNLCRELDSVTWETVKRNPSKVERLIREANEELNRLKQL